MIRSIYRIRDLTIMKTDIFSEKFLAAPLTRLFGFCLALWHLVWIDSYFGQILFDDESVVPFLILMIVPASFVFKLRWSVVSVVRRACVPIGIIVCNLNLVFIFSEMKPFDEVLVATRLLYAPLALGILMSFLLAILEPLEIYKYRPGVRDIIFVFLTEIITLILAIYYLVNATGAPVTIDYFIDTPAAQTGVVIIGICFINNKMTALNPIGKLYKASAAIILVSAILGVAAYAYTVSTDLSSIGRVAAGVSIGIFYGALLGLFAIIAGGTAYNSDQESMLYDWHTIEAYAFYTLIVMPPISLLESGLYGS